MLPPSPGSPELALHTLEQCRQLIRQHQPSELAVGGQRQHRLLPTTNLVPPRVGSAVVWWRDLPPVTIVTTEKGLPEAHPIDFVLKPKARARRRSWNANEIVTAQVTIKWRWLKRSTMATSHARIRANRLASTVQSMNAHCEEVRDLLEHLHERDQEISQLLSTIVEEQDHAERTAQIQEDLEMTPPESAAQPVFEGMRCMQTRSERQSEGQERGRRNVRRHVDEDEEDDEEDREASRRSSRTNTAGQWARGIARALANSRPHRLRQAGLAGTQSTQHNSTIYTCWVSTTVCITCSGSITTWTTVPAIAPFEQFIIEQSSSQGSQAPPAAGPGVNAPPARRDGGHCQADHNAPAVQHDGVRPQAAPNVCTEDQVCPRRQRERDVLVFGPDLDNDEEPPVDSIEQIGLHRCLEIIEVMVGEPPMDDPPHYLRISKLAAPSKFEGTDDANAFKIASDKWDQASYSASRGGIADLYKRLNKYAEQMFERPSDFKFRQRFLSALPSGMCEAIVLHQGHLAAMSMFCKIYVAALAYERGLDMMKALRTKKPSPVTTSGDKPQSWPSHPAGNHAAPRAVAHGAGHRSSQPNAGCDHFRPRQQ
ncbi:hypothetical protein A0H81_06574 [Grifola frondosa]|uniref:Uncharacterized protein n=1 Tax=Grifola frondosa TaxID=5627 RepID=A0A1C7MBB9_GRIFR|nr:hypothetical protein A0H81_06574 [Grifola frondosa]